MHVLEKNCWCAHGIRVLLELITTRLQRRGKDTLTMRKERKSSEPSADRITSELPQKGNEATNVSLKSLTAHAGLQSASDTHSNYVFECISGPMSVQLHNKLRAVFSHFIMPYDTKQYKSRFCLLNKAMTPNPVSNTILQPASTSSQLSLPHPLQS